jgi:hypothetical protein
MTPEQAAALRVEFPAAMIGKLPKGGIELDFVGHAAVTDRLLKVDAEWTWEPMALTPEGLPALDRAGNLWIRLTIGGVTRPGVGDGKNAKECISDAIRNAAMRFGVALDLWAKEDLHADETSASTTGATEPAAKSAGTTHTAAAGAPTTPAAAPPDDTFFPPEPAQGFGVPAGDRTEAQGKLLHAVLPKLVKAGAMTDEAFIAMARDNGATGETVNACIDTLGKVGASALISRLKDIEKQQVAA